MYGDQFGEFVCEYWGLEGLIRTISGGGWMGTCVTISLPVVY